ncbi:MAG: hypothetical protein ACJ751_05110 [Niastella sp.]|jgi:hypothetical protein|uniref:hypothetical protein n=1 Tax=Niastella sp. TaxID=1869183 RepID=UPI0038999114
MRPVFSLLLVVISLSSCQFYNEKEGLPFTKDSLMGNWMLIRVTNSAKIVSGNSDALYEYRDSVMAPLNKSLELTAFNFQPKGIVTIDDGKIEESTGQWYINDNKQILLQYKYLVEQDKSLFTIRHYWHDSLRLQNPIGKNQDTLFVNYILQKLRTNDSVPDLFDPALNKWRTKPTQPESDEAIKARLKQVIDYYSGYFANISGNRIPYFNIEKLLCPIKFYSGGIGMKKFKAADDWTKVYYDSTDAHKAHGMLDEAFDKLKGYPDRGGNFAAEYAASLKMLVKVL